MCKTYKGRVARAGQSYGHLLQQSIVTILYPFQNNSKRSQSFIVVGSGCYTVVLALLGRFPWNRRTFMGNHIQALTSIQALTALNWVHHSDESDPLENEKLIQRNTDKFLQSSCPGKLL